MTKNLKHLSSAAEHSPFSNIASAIIATENINGHVADDAEIRELLVESNIDPDEESVGLVRAEITRARGTER